MSPITHTLISWVAANAARLPKRDRLLVTCAGILPDLDGIGIVAEIATKNALPWYSKYHHIIGHNIGFGLLLVMIGMALAVKRIQTVIWIGIVFHLHLLGDLIGSRGPDGYQWPIPYFLPFSDDLQITWSGQWGLNAWPNILTTVLMLMATFYLAWRRGYSPLEMISPKADARFIASLRRRFGPAVEK